MADSGFDEFLDDQLEKYQAIAEELPNVLVSMGALTKLLNHGLSAACVLLMDADEFKGLTHGEIKDVVLKSSTKALIAKNVADQAISDMFNNFKNN
jgi:hypothetical protein